MNNLLDFGRYSAKTLASLFFGIGSLGIAVASWFVGHNVASTHVWHRTVQHADGWWTGVSQNHVPLGIFAALLCFIISVLFWRLVCEAIYILLNYFKENTPRK